jgi:hypothetical protein
MYGHSQGASIAFCFLAPSKGVPNAATAVHGLVLENAFASRLTRYACSTQNAGYLTAAFACLSVTGGMHAVPLPCAPCYGAPL